MAFDKLIAFLQALAPFAWPVAVVAIALLFRRFVGSLAERDKLTIKVAGMELSVAEATEQAGKSLSDLQLKVAELEERFIARPGPERGAETTIAATDDAVQPGLSILWVDDYPSNNAFIMDRLEAEGHRIRKELSTDAAMSALGQDRFDVVISDLGRVEAGRDNPYAGLDLMRAMKAAACDLPVLIFAGPRGVKNQEKLMNAGAAVVTDSAVDIFAFIRSRASHGQH